MLQQKKCSRFLVFFHEQEIKITKKTWKNYSAVAAADVFFLFKKEEQKVGVREIRNSRLIIEID